jgi:hypothetical protein
MNAIERATADMTNLVIGQCQARINRARAQLHSKNVDERVQRAAMEAIKADTARLNELMDR